VLIVDDDENLVTNLAAFLETNHFEVERAKDVEGAVRAVVSGRVRIALVDYRLDRQNGIEVLVAIRRRVPELPIILTSAHLDDWLEALLRVYKPTRCLRKPFTAAEVLGMMGEVLVASGERRPAT
jgi:DNA-binding response OmpR family regulator